jgi:hypothetical protein
MILFRAMAFPRKLNHLLCQQYDCVEICSENSFRITNKKKFEKEVLPKYSTSNTMASFNRQLNIYGFRKIVDGPHKDAHFHRDFLIGNFEHISKHVLRKPTSPKKRAASWGETNRCAGANSCLAPIATGFKRDDKHQCGESLWKARKILNETHQLAQSWKRTESRYEEVKTNHEHTEPACYPLPHSPIAVEPKTFSAGGVNSVSTGDGLRYYSFDVGQPHSSASNDTEEDEKYICGFSLARKNGEQSESLFTRRENDTRNDISGFSSN